MVKNIIQFPDYIQFNYCKKSFHCMNAGLISLKGFPKFVGHVFSCDYNNLTSLKYCPIEVKSDFYCGNNKKYFTERYVRKLCNVNGKIYNEDY